MTAREEFIRVPRTARYRVLGDPDSASEVWFVLHGYRQLAERFVSRFIDLPGLAAGRRAVVAPEALSRFYFDDEGGGEHGPESKVGATWMTRVDREHEIRDYVEYLDRLAATVLRGSTSGSEVAPPGAGPIGAGRRVVVLGFSQGAATASRWAVYGRVRPAELVLWGAGLAEDLDLERAAEALDGVTVRFVVGGEDPWAKKRAARSRRRLQEVGLDSERVDYAGGHRVLPEVLATHWP